MHSYSKRNVTANSLVESVEAELARHGLTLDDTRSINNKHGIKILTIPQFKTRDFEIVGDYPDNLGSDLTYITDLIIMGWVFVMAMDSDDPAFYSWRFIHLATYGLDQQRKLLY